MVQELVTVRELTHFVGGKHVAGTSGRFGDVFDPNTGHVQARVPLASSPRSPGSSTTPSRHRSSGRNGTRSVAPGY